MMSDYAKFFAIAATAFAGIVMGCLTFVSFVDVRSFIMHLNNKKIELIQMHFPIWWPCGRDLMVPLLGCGTLCNAFAAYYYYPSINFVVSSTLLALIGPYTKFVLGEDIETLRKLSNPSQIDETARRFCNLHHVRLVAATIAFGFALVALAEL